MSCITSKEDTFKEERKCQRKMHWSSQSEKKRSDNKVTWIIHSWRYDCSSYMMIERCLGCLIHSPFEVMQRVLFAFPLLVIISYDSICDVSWECRWSFTQSRWYTRVHKMMIELFVLKRDCERRKHNLIALHLLSHEVMRETVFLMMIPRHSPWQTSLLRGSACKRTVLL